MARQKKSPAKNRTPRRTGAEYRFKIDAYTPDTMPMARLAEYMAELATILGEPTAVHFERLEASSTVLVHRIEREAVPKVRARVASVRRGDAPADAERAFKAVNRMLREDDGVAALADRKGGAIIIRFPGRDEVQEAYPQVREYGSIDGEIVGIVGADKTVHVRLLIDGKQVSGCWTDRRIGKELGHLLYEPVRLFGKGCWSREGNGTWSLVSFKIEGFEKLKAAPLSEALADIRSIPFTFDGDAFEELSAIRHGLPSKANGGH